MGESFALGMERDSVLEEIRRQEGHGRRDETKTLRTELHKPAASNTRTQIRESRSPLRQQGPVRACAAPGRRGRVYRHGHPYAREGTNRQPQSRTAQDQPTAPQRVARSSCQKCSSRNPCYPKCTLHLANLDVLIPNLVARFSPLPISLTPQPFLPKLRLTNYMRAPKLRLPLLALLLVLVLLGAQLHFCADAVAGPPGSHFCPVCSAADSIVPSTLIVCDGLTSVERFDQCSPADSVPAVISFVLSLRAPPTL
jgi:hypothetical protein